MRKKAYKFRELSETAKEKVINEYVQNLIDMTDFKSLHKSNGMYKAYKKTIEDGKPEELKKNILHFYEKQIIPEVKQYEYYVNGDLYEEE